MTNYYVIKISKNNKELLEVMESANEKEARKIACRKYMDVVLSCTNQLAVVTKSAYEQYYQA